MRRRAAPAGGATLTREAVEADVRRRLLGPGEGRGTGPVRIGLEIEMLPVFLADGMLLPIEGPGVSTTGILRAAAAVEGWREGRSRAGAPTFDVAEEGRFSFEPGGQLEYSSAPQRAAGVLLHRCERAFSIVQRHAEAQGAALLTRGVDPARDLAAAPLRLAAGRYRLMDEYFARIGPFGARMMRQTAALQINLDGGETPLDRWRVLNAAAPFLLALFANSPAYAGVETGHASYRAHIWRRTDRARTGLPGSAGDPVTGYTDFALDAPVMLRTTRSGEYASARAWLARGLLDEALWEEHCTTLFPEVRPRGYLELRSIDAIPPGEWSAALALASGLACDERSCREALELLPAPDDSLLRCAGERGLADPRIAAITADLVSLGLRGAAELGSSWLHAQRLEQATEAVSNRLQVASAGGIRAAPVGASAADGASSVLSVHA